MKNNIETKRHSYSHVLAAAVLEMFPEAKLAIGPAIDNGFYYDFDLPRTLIPEDLPILEEKMRKLIAKNLDFKKTEVPIKEALDEAKKNKQIYKAELIEDIPKKVRPFRDKKVSPFSDPKGTVSFYRVDGFVDLCAGPHVKNTSELDPNAFKLASIAGAYWRGDEKNKMLQRIYGLAFETEKELADYEKLQEEAKKRDHRKLGKELDLFSFHDEAPGFPFWHPKGMILRELLMKPYDELHKQGGYETISTPILMEEGMWHRSGHWDHYKENMYFTKIDGRSFAIKPMNCPGSIIVYNSQLRSYRDLPIKLGEKGEVHRHEPSGTLHGLFRVRAFRQDDSHIFAREDQVAEEIKKIVNLTLDFYKIFDFSNIKIELSTRPDNSIGSDEIWEKSENIMKKVLNELKLDFVVNAGDGAFYGPKIDFHISDCLGRTWQCGTVQLDFSMPERFDLTYINKDGSKTRPVMIHRTVLGSIQRFVGIIIEHYAGAFPAWLAPVQARFIPVSDKFVDYCKKAEKTLIEAGLRVEVDESKESVGKKIRAAEMAKIPYMIVIGEKEIEAKNVSVRSYTDGDLGQIPLDKLAEKLLDKVIL